MGGRVWPAALLFTACVVCIVFLVGFATPYWAIYDSGLISINQGLWQICLSGLGTDSCSSWSNLVTSIFPSLQVAGGLILGAQITSCLALGCMLVAGICYIIWLSRHTDANPGRCKTEATVAGIFEILAGLMATTSVSLYGMTFNAVVLEGWSTWLVVASAVASFILGSVTLYRACSLPRGSRTKKGVVWATNTHRRSRSKPRVSAQFGSSRVQPVVYGQYPVGRAQSQYTVTPQYPSQGVYPSTGYSQPVYASWAY